MHPPRAAILTLALLAPLPEAFADNPDLVVSKFSDSLDGVCDADCSLREAVQQANQTHGASRIVLAAGTYRLGIPTGRLPDDDDPLNDDDANLNGDLDVSGELLIVGRGIDITIVDGARIDRVFEALPGARVDFERLSIRNGLHPYLGGGIAVNAGASVQLRHCALSQNTASGVFTTGYGGALWNAGTLTVNDARIDGNLAGGREGFLGAGGAIHNTGTLTVRDSRFLANRAGDDDDGSAGGAIWNIAAADIRRSSFEQNRVQPLGSGSAIHNGEAGVLRLENSTVSDGYDRETETVVGAVVNGARSDRTQRATMRIVNSTIADNLDYGLVNRANLSIANSIIVGNGFPGFDDGSGRTVRNCVNLGTQFRFSQSGLLRGSDEGNCPTTLLVLDDDAFRTVLWPLAANNNAGLPTFALRKVSIAIDAAVGNCASQDQRGSPRPRDGNGDGIAACDLGAYERPRP